MRFGTLVLGLLAVALLSSGCDRSDSPAVSEKPGEVVEASETLPELLARRDWSAAESIATRTLVADPEDWVAGMAMVQIHNGRGNVEQAIAAIDDLAQRHPQRRGPLLAQAAELTLQTGDVTAAIERFGELVKRQGDFVEARLRLASLLNARGFRGEAGRHFRIAAGEAGLDIDELVGLVFPVRTFVTFSEKPDIHDEATIRRVGALSIARALHMRGDTAEAIKCLKASDLIAASDPAAMAMLGWMLSATQDYPALTDWAIKAPSACREYPEYWMAVGQLARHRRDAVAVDCFALAIEREPAAIEAWDALVEALEFTGDKTSAASVREKRELIRETRFLAGELSRQSGQQPVLDPTMVSRMAKLLGTLGRPIESLAWQETSIARVSPGSDSLQTLADYKRKTIQRYPRGLTPDSLALKIDDSAATDRFLASIGRETKSETGPPVPLDTTPVVPSFVNVADQIGLDFQHRNEVVPVEREFKLFEALGSGVACLDVDRDGWVDFYFGQAGGSPTSGTSELSNRLFLQREGSLSEQTVASRATDRGYTMGVTAGDWNQDGFADLVIANLGVNRLLINQGDGSFREARFDPANSGESPPSVWDWRYPTSTMSVAIADLTGDGLPEMIEANYVDDPRAFEPIARDSAGKPLNLPGPLHFNAAVGRFFVSSGDGRMTGRPFGSDAVPAKSTGLGLIVTDLDDDGANDVLVANDQTANHWWSVRAEPDGGVTTIDAAVTSGLAYGVGGQAMACMGIAVADFDGNQRQDVHVTNFLDQWSNHYLQAEPGIFWDAAGRVGIDRASASMLGFGVQAVDYDNNGDWDLIVGNGHIEDYREAGKAFAMPTQVIAPESGRYRVMDVQGDDDYWNAGHLTRGLAKCDWNRDGRIDVLATELNAGAVLLENRTTTDDPWLQIVVVGRVGERDAIGASLTVIDGQDRWTQVVQTGDGYLCKNEPMLHFGLGATGSTTVTVQVRWPSGETQTFDSVDIDQRVMLIEAQPDPWIDAGLANE